jgi:hypothetical protein
MDTFRLRWRPALGVSVPQFEPLCNFEFTNVRRLTHLVHKLPITLFGELGVYTVWVRIPIVRRIAALPHDAFMKFRLNVFKDAPPDVVQKSSNRTGVVIKNVAVKSLIELRQSK